jgi:hypothetical protein
MNDSLINSLLPYILSLIGAIVTGLVSVIGVLMGKWITMMKVKATIENGGIAVKAIEQLYPGLSNEQKKDMALRFAQTLNTDAGIKTPDVTQTTINESHVLTLPVGPGPTGSDVPTPIIPLG